MPNTTDNTCPICNEPLGSDDFLVATYYAPKNWWVVRHLKPRKGQHLPAYLLGASQENLIDYCSEARFNPPTRSE